MSLLNWGDLFAEKKLYLVKVELDEDTTEKVKRLVKERKTIVARFPDDGHTLSEMIDTPKAVVKGTGCVFVGNAGIEQEDNTILIRLSGLKEVSDWDDQEESYPLECLSLASNKGLSIYCTDTATYDRSTGKRAYFKD